MVNAVMIIHNGFEEIEAICVVDILRRGGVDCSICSADTDSTHKVVGSHNISLEADINIEDLIVDDFSAVIIPGGMPGAENLKNDKRVIKAIKKFNNCGKLVCAICAAPIVLKKAGIIENKEVTSYPSFKKELIGCKYVDKDVVKCDNIITSRGPCTAITFGLKILESIMDKETAEKVKISMLGF